MANATSKILNSGVSIAALSLGLAFSSPAHAFTDAAAQDGVQDNTADSMVASVQASPEAAQTAGEAEGDSAADTKPKQETKPESIVGDEPDSGIIIVTAQLRAQNLQDVPVAVSAYDSEFLTENLVDNVYDLALYTPSLNVNTVQGGGISIRGIAPAFSGSFTNNPVAVYVDGVFQGAAGSDGFLFGDIADVEVLRGPQGTLYGRNATSGAINVNTRKPTTTWTGLAEGYGTYGEPIGIGPSYMTWRGRAALRGPLISDKVLFSVVGIYQSTGDYVHNFVRDVNSNGSHRFDVRSQLLIRPADVFDLRVIVDYSNLETPRFDFADKNNALLLSRVPPLRAPPSDAYVRGGSAAGSRGYSKRDTWGISGQANLYLSDAVTLTSITAYRKAKAESAYDIDGTSVPLIVSGTAGKRIPADQFSEELRVNYDGRRVDLVAGAFYWDEHATSIPGVGVNAFINTKAWALFAQGTYNLTERLAFTGGLRYSNEKKRVDYVPPLPMIPPLVKASWESWTPRVALEYKPRPDILLYASASKGFKSGGFGFTGQIVEPETLWSYEAGAKMDLLHNLLRLNTAAFYMDYTNLQVRTPNPLAPGTFTIDNAAAATVWGIEVESVLRPSQRWLFTFSGSYLNSHYDDFASLCGLPGTVPCNLAGNELIAAPPWKFSGTAQYTHPLANGSDLSFRTTAQYESPAFASEFNRPEERVKEKFDLSAYITWTSASKAWEVSVFGTNLTSHKVDYGNILVPLGLTPVPILAVFPGFERQWGARVSLRF